MILVKDSKERERFFKFAVVGSIGFLVDTTTFNLVRQLTGLMPVIANVISFCVAVISNFIFNRYWTYPDSRSKPISGQLGQFALVNIAGLAIRTLIFSTIHRPLSLAAEQLFDPKLISPEVLGENASLAIVVIVVMFWNFFVNRVWTYNDV